MLGSDNKPGAQGTRPETCAKMSACFAPLASHMRHETHFLNALKDSIETGHSPADELLAYYNGAWDGDLSRIYGEFSY